MNKNPSMKEWNKARITLFWATFIVMIIGGLINGLVGMTIASFIYTTAFLSYKCTCLENTLYERHKKNR